MLVLPINLTTMAGLALEKGMIASLKTNLDLRLLSPALAAEKG